MNDNNLKCLTCDEEMEKCYGHFGYIKLMLPIFHLGFFTDII